MLIDDARDKKVYNFEGRFQVADRHIWIRNLLGRDGGKRALRLWEQHVQFSRGSCAERAKFGQDGLAGIFDALSSFVIWTRLVVKHGIIKD